MLTEVLSNLYVRKDAFALLADFFRYCLGHRGYIVHINRTLLDLTASHIPVGIILCLKERYESHELLYHVDQSCSTPRTTHVCNEQKR